jgi:predicted aspartyl protease
LSLIIIINYGIYSLGKEQAEPYVVDVLVSNERIKMEVDTGAVVSVMNEDTYTLLKKKHPNL